MESRTAAIATLTLDGPVVPKARPRVTRSGHAFMPQNYRKWKADAIAALTEQWEGREAIAVPVAIVIRLQGKHGRSGDSDNVAGAILDAMQDAEILRNDNLKAVPSMAIALHHGATPPTTTITISPIASTAA